jgi:hypothetical protein
MIIHGDDDRILPADVTSRRQVKMIKNVKFIEIKGGDQYRTCEVPLVALKNSHFQNGKKQGDVV